MSESAATGVVVNDAPILDGRTADQIVADLSGRVPGYLRGWHPGQKGPGAALLQIGGRFIESLLERLNQAPEKNKLAFLAMLGIDLVAPSPARVPVVFVLQPNAGDSRAAAGTRVAAPPPPDATSQINFETETSTGLAAAQIAQVVSYWPGRDQYIDHTTDFLAGQAITPFALPKLVDVPHELYIGHSTILALAGSCTVGVWFDVTSPASPPMPVVWEYWDGQVWREFQDMRPACTGESPSTSYDGTGGFASTGTFKLKADGVQSSPTTVHAVETSWIRARLRETLPPDAGRALPWVDQIRLTTTIDRSLSCDTLTAIPPIINSGCGLLPDLAFTDTVAIDLTKTFYPFGNAPQVGSTFFFALDEAFGKPGAVVQIAMEVPFSAQDTLYYPQTWNSATDCTPNPNVKVLTHGIAWEYWNGVEWTSLTVTWASSSLNVPPTTPPCPALPNEVFDPTTFRIIHTLDPAKPGFCAGFSFTVPSNIATTIVNKQSAFWIRARLANGGFGYTVAVGGYTTIYVTVPNPPAFDIFRIGYKWTQGPYSPEHVLTYNDFTYQDQTGQVIWQKQPIQPFQFSSDQTPALYLGFDKQLPYDTIGVFFDIAEIPSDVLGPGLVWEYWDGFTWDRIPAEDETNNLRVPGLLSFTAEQDAAPLNRFDRPAPASSTPAPATAPPPTSTPVDPAALWWVRGRLKEDGPPGAPTLNGIYLNAAWALQQTTLVNDPIGTADGRPNLTLNFKQYPVLPGEQIQVQELSAPCANTEWRLLVADVAGQNSPDIAAFESLLASEGPQTEFQLHDIRIVRDRNKVVTAVWVQWHSQDNFLGSGTDDRDYVLNHITGQLEFGDGQQGMIPPDGAAVLAVLYRTGGGQSGNVPARTISQVLAAVGATEQVFNPIAAGGGGDAETLVRLSSRGPQTVRHRGRAVLPEDYEAMAMEVSAAVAVAHCLPCRDSGGFFAPGWLTLTIIPNSTDPRPWPSFGLREEIRQYIEARAGAELVSAGRIYITGPQYTPVDVEATIAPIDFGNAGPVEQAVHDALARFLHPLTGGPTGDGWQPGRAVFLSDVAVVLSRVEGLDFVQELTLSLAGAPQGDQAQIPPTNIVCAGTFLIKVTGE